MSAVERGIEEVPRVAVAVQSLNCIESIRSSLACCGCQTICVSERHSLSKLMREDKIDAIVVDPHFDEESGESFWRTFPEIVRWPVLAYMPGNTDLDEIIAIVRAGVADVMTGQVEAAKIERFADRAREVAVERRSAVISSLIDHPGSRGNGASNVRNGHSKQAANGNGSVQEVTSPARDAHASSNAQGGDPDFRLDEFLVGSSVVMEAIRRRVAEVADTKATVMISGESGTGKEVVATAIHRLSRRWNAPFIPLNMAAIPEGLAESLLFGHQKGAFTGAVKQQLGHCEMANNGTMFLDEISEMEIQIQPKLLRFLQSGVFQRIGAENQQVADIRIITATNRDPKTIVREGRLREDLFFRLHVVPIHIPPLRERSEDIEQLGMVFLERFARVHERNVEGFSRDAIDALREFDWPGNVRQLENIVERMVIFARGRLITAADVPADAQDTALQPHRFNGASTSNGQSVDEPSESLKGHANACSPQSTPPIKNPDQLKPIQRRERAAIIEALEIVDGHVIDAARLLGLGQATVYRKIKQYAIPHQRRRRRTRPK